MELIGKEYIENKIYTIRNLQVMIDKDLAELYQVETKVLNQAVKRNSNRFPDAFRFQLKEDEFNNLKSQSVTSSSSHGGRRYLPYVFTEQGVAMLSAVLKSETAVTASIQIMDAFVRMRHHINQNSLLQERLFVLESKQSINEKNFETIFKALDKAQPEPKHGIFFEGQIFDAYAFVAELIKSAKKSIILIDNYIDESVLTLLTKRSSRVKASIYTAKISKSLQLDIEKHNQQYPTVEVKSLKTSHDRFLIIDDTELYHIGASLKDLGKKWFAFSQMNSLCQTVLNQLNTSAS